MRTFRSAVLASLALLAASVSTAYGQSCTAGEDDSCCAVDVDNCCGDCDFGPTWEWHAGVLYMRRENSSDNLLVERAAGNVSLINASDFDFNYEPGIDLGAIYRYDCDRAVEVRYLWLDDMGAQADFTQAASNVTIFTTPTTNWNGAETGEFDYATEVQSLEVNLLRNPCGNNWYWGAGFRYLNLEEEFAGRIEGAGGAVGSDIAWETENDLFGFQLALKGSRQLGCSRFRINSFAKAGLYWADQDADFVVSGAGFGSTATDSNDQAAFVGEAGIDLVYEVRCNVTLKAGYQLLFVDGAALASEQVSTTDQFNTTGVRPMTINQGSVLFHGLNFGLVITR